MRVSGFRRISALLLLFLLASQSDSFSVERRQVFVDLLATGTTASTVVFAVAPAQGMCGSYSKALWIDDCYFSIYFVYE